MTEKEFHALQPGQKVRRDHSDPSHTYEVKQPPPPLPQGGIAIFTRTVVVEDFKNWHIVPEKTAP